MHTTFLSTTHSLEDTEVVTILLWVWVNDTEHIFIDLVGIWVLHPFLIFFTSELWVPYRFWISIIDQLYTNAFSISGQTFPRPYNHFPVDAVLTSAACFCVMSKVIAKINVKKQFPYALFPERYSSLVLCGSHRPFHARMSYSLSALPHYPLAYESPLVYRHLSFYFHVICFYDLT